MEGRIDGAFRLTVDSLLHATVDVLKTDSNRCSLSNSNTPYQPRFPL